MNEAALFDAYRNHDYGFAVECACGDVIRAERALDVEVAISVHNESPVHQQWRAWQAAVAALQRPVRRKCVCGGHRA